MEENKKVIIDELNKLINDIKNDKFDEKELFNMQPFIKGWNKSIVNNIDDPIRLLYLGYYVDEIYKNMV